jgi:hypothetical protein
MKIKIQLVYLGQGGSIYDYKDFFFNPPNNVDELLRHVSYALTSGNINEIRITKWNAETGEKLK